MGFDIERFSEPVNDGLLCCICRDVLEDPVQSPCEHAFCRLCIEGWLVQENRCPEDRKPLSLSQLKPLYRYMRNDLHKLKIRCRNSHLGCTHVGELEHIEYHEAECLHTTVRCTNDRCGIEVTRRELSAHLTTCQFRTKDCPKGCGMLMVIAEDESHNCLSELRTAVDVLRSEMACKLDGQRREMELRLDMQRGHMVQKESAMQVQVDELKSDISRLSQKIKLLMDLEIQRRQELEKLQLEKRELMELLKGHQRDQCEPGPSKGHPRPALRGKVTTI